MLTVLAAFVAYAYDPVVQSAAWETLCNVPIDIETSTDIDETAPIAPMRPTCDAKSIAEAFMSVFPNCQVHARVVDGRVRVVPGQATEKGCGPTPSKLDIPLGVEVGADYPTLFNAFHRVGVYETLLPVGSSGGPFTYPVEPTTTVRQILHMYALAPGRDGRLSSVLVRHHPAEWCEKSNVAVPCVAFYPHGVGGSYMALLNRHFEGPYDHRTQWWVTEGPRYRPLTDEEAIRSQLALESHARGEISDLQLAEINTAIAAALELNPQPDGTPWKTVLYEQYDPVTGAELVP